MQCKCTVSDNTIEKPYAVIYKFRGSPDSRIVQHDTFESAYLAACEYTNWNREQIKIDVYPKDVRDVLKKVTKSLVKLKFEENRAKDLAEYKRLKQKFDPDPPDTITELQ